MKLDLFISKSRDEEAHLEMRTDQTLPLTCEATVTGGTTAAPRQAGGLVRVHCETPPRSSLSKPRVAQEFLLLPSSQYVASLGATF